METTLALALISAGMLSLAGAFSQIVKSNTAVNRKQMAVLLADSKLSEMCALPVSQVNQLKGAFDEPFGNYSWRAEFKYPPDNEGIADIWLEVKHKSNVGVRLWTQMAIDNAH